MQLHSRFVYFIHHQYKNKKCTIANDHRTFIKCGKQKENVNLEYTRDGSEWASRFDIFIRS